MVAMVVGTVLATLSVCFGIAGGVAFYVRQKPKPVEGVEPARAEMVAGRAEIIEGRVGALEGSMAALQLTLDGLPTIWKDERERTKNQADRAVAAYKSTEEVLEALSGGGEDGDEDQEIRGDDGAGVGLMSPLFGDVAGSAQRADTESDVRERARRHLSMG